MKSSWGKPFIAQIDWKDHFMQERMKSVKEHSRSNDDSSSGYVYYPPDAERASDADMEVLANKAEIIKHSPFALLVMTSTYMVWQQLTSFVICFQNSERARDSGRLGLIVLLPDRPPKLLLETLGVLGQADLQTRLTFVSGNPRNKRDLLEAGVK